MRKLIFLLAISFVFVASCKKSPNNTNTSKPNSVTINGTVYPTAVIGGQTWTTLNYDGPGGIANPNEQESLYGKFYNLPEAQAIVLPNGWRVPNQDDFIKLLASQGDTSHDSDGTTRIDTIGAAHLRSTTYWTLPGDNMSGFNAQPSGYYNYYLQQFDNIYAYAYFWSTTLVTHGIGPSTETVLVLFGYRDSPGLLYYHEVGAYTFNEEAGSEIGYNLRFVKDN